MAERGLLAALEGSCHSPVAVLCQADGLALIMRAVLFSENGGARIDGEVVFPAGDEAGPRALAAELLSRAPVSIAALFAGGG